MRKATGENLRAALPAVCASFLPCPLSVFRLPLLPKLSNLR